MGIGRFNRERSRLTMANLQEKGAFRDVAKTLNMDSRQVEKEMRKIISDSPPKEKQAIYDKFCAITKD